MIIQQIKMCTYLHLAWVMVEWGLNGSSQVNTSTPTLTLPLLGGGNIAHYIEGSA